MIEPICDLCGQRLTKPGALVFSPPATVERGSEVKKYHVCTRPSCWPGIESRLEAPS